MLGKYHVIFVQAKDNYASRSQQDYILKKQTLRNLEVCLLYF